ncbi:UEV domain-containing protein [Russula brevipes]|nr:UEV domain-containing protein [Russula brevipes]
MSSSESLTQKWLRQNVAAYNDGNRVFADVDATLSLYPTLRPKTDVYTYDDGRSQLLLCIHGLLPIDYRQASYHIPISIWLTRQYPREPPLAFVVPTSDMLVRPSRSLDVSGLCRIDYVLDWERKYEGCDLRSLVQAMQRYFSNEPPVYSKPKSGPSSPSSRPSQPVAPPRPTPPLPRPFVQQPPPPPPPPFPRPIVQQPPPPIASPLASPSSSRPTPPPKPSNTSSPAVPYQLSPSVGFPHSDSHSNISPNPPPPPKPPLPPPLFSPPSQPLHSPAPTHVHNRASSLGPTFQPQLTPSRWQGTPAIPPPEPIPPSSSRRSLLPGQSHSPVTAVAYSSYVAGTNLTRSQQPPLPAEHPPVPLAPPNPQQQGTTAPPRPNLLDEDATGDDTPPLPVQAAPPRPPNPELLQLHARVHEKLRAELASVSQAMTLDAERLRAQQADLLTGVPAIRDEMGRLEAVRDVCRGVAARLGETIETAERGVAELKRKGDPPVDELVCSTSIVHNQYVSLFEFSHTYPNVTLTHRLVDLVAEDSAIEDTIYHLHRALNAGRIDLDRFLRTTRVLAEEQFMKRALIERIHRSLPMGASVHPGWT